METIKKNKMITERELFEAYIGQSIEQWIIQNKSGIFNRFIQSDDYIEELNLIEKDQDQGPATETAKKLLIIGCTTVLKDLSKKLYLMASNMLKDEIKEKTLYQIRKEHCFFGCGNLSEKELNEFHLMDGILTYFLDERPRESHLLMAKNAKGTFEAVFLGMKK
jgi:hypothetical protein